MLYSKGIGEKRCKLTTSVDRVHACMCDMILYMNVYEVNVLTSRPIWESLKKLLTFTGYTRSVVLDLWGWHCLSVLFLLKLDDDYGSNLQPLHLKYLGRTNEFGFWTFFAATVATPTPVEVTQVAQASIAFFRRVSRDHFSFGHCKHSLGR